MFDNLEYQYKTIVFAISKGAKTINEIAKECGGLYPFELQPLLTHLEDTNLISNDKGEYRLNFKNVKKILNTSSTIILPEPHPLDYDWRFDKKSIKLITSIVNYETVVNGNALLLGAPSIFRELSTLEIVPNATLIDKSDKLIHSLSSQNLGVALTCYQFNLLTEKLYGEPNCFDVVVCDPPWYPEYYFHFISQAAYSLTIGGKLVVSLLPSNTRPNADKDRWEIIEFAERCGLHIEILEKNALHYKTPEFEKKSLSITGLPISDWRPGDLLVLQKVKNINTVVKNKKKIIIFEEANEWEEVIIKGMHKIKIKSNFNDFEDEPELITIEKDNILPTVSRRYEGRKYVDLWFWNNTVYSLKGGVYFRKALKLLNSGDNVLNTITDEKIKKAYLLLIGIINI